ncbi:sensor histidine kinase [Brachybacterium alimentarium]|uniref:sensor histidine kinase n=1 Tax=Brachybacterium alimentarium TaxID=47845 RepID=UPI0015F08FFF|nr:sensor histidine kinase [Brachybacterium alimentarium]
MARFPALDPAWVGTAAPGAPRGPTGGTSSRPLDPMLGVWMPPVLLLVAWAVGWIGAQSWLLPEHVLWALVPTTLLLGLRAVMETVLRRTGQDSTALRALYSVHVALVAIGLLLNPLTCIYAFVGYLDSARFLDGARARAVVVATALLCAVGQVGGIRVVRAETGLFVGLAVVNLLLAAGMLFLAAERERVLAQREHALIEVGRVNAENAELHDELIAGARRAGADEERTRLSREIHDTVAQGLIGVIRQLEAVGPDIDAESRHRVTVAEEAARDCLLEARRAVEALGPHQLHDTDVVDALSGLVARWTRTHRVVATFDADEATRDGPHGDVLVRIAQEALANVARHAGATTVTVTLAGDEHESLLRISDDGAGFEADHAPRGHGLANMADRARRAGGSLRVLSAPGQGCTVTASVPR